MAHVKELLEQAKDKLALFCPDIPIGLYSAGLGEKNANGPIIVAGIQSVYRRASELGRFDLIIIDEAHTLPEEGDGMYRQFLGEMKIINPQVRLIGLTATPYRMSSGTLCGPGKLLTDICCDIGVKELIAQGYLCPLVTKGSRTPLDYSSLHLRAGEFISSEVEEVVNTESNVQAACREMLERTEDRNKVLIFASSVEHAVRVQETIAQMTGSECGLITGATDAYERDLTIRRFKGETLPANLFGDPVPELKYLANINVLTTGFDAPNVDCVVMLRPTASPGLYQQMVGRGLRLHESKKDCLVLDFGGNILRHGPIDAIRIREKGDSDGEAPAKQCPECQMIMHAAYSVCPGCGYTFPPRTTNGLTTQASDKSILSCDETAEYDVEDVFYAVHTKSGADESAPKTMRVDYRLGFNQFKCEWLCVEHEGWPRRKFEQWWKQRTTAPLPSSVREAVAVASGGALAKPLKITVTLKAGEKYDRVTDYVLGPIPDPTAPPTETSLHSCGDCLYYGENWCSATCRTDVREETPDCPQFLDKEEIPF